MDETKIRVKSWNHSTICDVVIDFPRARGFVAAFGMTAAMAGDLVQEIEKAT